MKVIKKELVCDEEDIDWVQTEKHVFETASNHPFLVGLHSCFQSSSFRIEKNNYISINVIFYINDTSCSLELMYTCTYESTSNLQNTIVFGTT